MFQYHRSPVTSCGMGFEVRSRYMVASMKQREPKQVASWPQGAPDTGKAQPHQPSRHAQTANYKETVNRKEIKTGKPAHHTEGTLCFDEHDRYFSDEPETSGRATQQRRHRSTHTIFDYDDDEYQNEDEADHEDHEVENAI